MRLLKLDRVLVASDLEATSDAAVVSAYALSRIAEAALTLLHVAPVRDGAGEDRSIDEALSRAGVRRGDLAVERAAGAPVQTIQTAAERLSADVIVLGPHRGAGVARESGLGSTAYGVVAGARVPCLVLTEPLRLPLERVLVPIDLSETARGALMIALTWSSALRTRGGEAKLSVLHVDAAGGPGAADDDRVARELDAVQRAGGTWAGVSVRPDSTVSDDVAATIAARAAGHDLVVLGTRGLGAASAEGIGSIAAALLRRASLPLLLVPPAVWRAYAPE
jgi:nucleotide-binding universal stress UspA family protein